MNDRRIYLLIDTFLPLIGGAERQVFSQSVYLQAAGWEATIVTLRYKQSWPALEYMEGIPVIRIGGKILSWHARVSGIARRLCYLTALLWLFRELWSRRHHYDLLQVYQLTPFALPALLLARLTGKPLVIAMRSDPPAPQRGERAPRTGADLEAFERLGKPCLALLNCLLCSTHACITILSKRMYRSLARCHLQNVETLLIPNGVDTARFQPVPWSAERSLTVVCVARLRQQKGIDVLLHAWRILLVRWPQARLIIAGDGPLWDTLHTLMTELDITGSVEFTGLSLEVAQEYQRGQIAVLPSRWEGMPNALLEAMACGLACVATRVSGSEDLLQQGRYGLLVEPEDPQALARALLHLLQDTALTRYYGHAARQHVEQLYSVEACYAQYTKLYSKLLQQTRQASNSQLSLCEDHPSSG
jgi:glycosyltransferase involved in cell wall biosynthesis